MDTTIENIHIWLRQRDWDSTEFIRLIEQCTLTVICDGKPTTKLAALPTTLQEYIVTKIGHRWSQMTRAEQDQTRALYNASYRYNAAVASTLRLYALHWCDTGAQVTLARTLAAERHRALRDTLRDRARGTVPLEHGTDGAIDEEMDDSDVEWHRLIHERDSVNEARDTARAATAPDDALDAETVARLEEWRDTCHEDSADWSTLTDILRDISAPAKLGKACAVLDLARQSDDVVSRAVQCVLGPEVSYVRCRALIDHVLTPRITALQFPASRTLLALLISLARLHPKPFLDAVLVPLALNPASGTIQFEIIQRITRDALPAEENISFLSTQSWSELTVQLLQHVLSSKLEFDAALFDTLVTQLQRQVTCLANSPKFSAFIFALISKYAALSRTHAEILRQILHKCQGWMVTKALTKLDDIAK